MPSSSLMAAVDEYIPQPDRPQDQPFLMPIEDVFSISGRGTVVTGRIERGIVNVGEEIEIVGIKDTEDDVYRRRDVPEASGSGEAGDNVGVLLRGTNREGVERGQVLAKPGSITAAYEVQGGGLHPDERRRGPSYAVLHELSPAVLLPDDGRYGDGCLCRKALRW